MREKEKRARDRFEKGEPPQKKQKLTSANVSAKLSNDENAFMLDDYESEPEGGQSTRSGELGLSVETQALIDKLSGSSERYPKATADVEDETKIFYCSRTHSQLSQFVHELQRVQIPPAIPLSDPNDVNNGSSLPHEEAKHITLGSRKILCINDKVKSLSSVTAINDRCLELQQSGASTESKCSFLPNKDNEVLVNDFRDHALAHVRDIEDFGRLGKKLGICPYYAARASKKPAEVSLSSLF